MFLREFGRNDEADELARAYTAAQPDDPRFFDLSYHHFSTDAPVDPTLKAAFEARQSSFKDERDPKGVLLAIGRGEPWRDEDVRLLANVTIDAFEASIVEGAAASVAGVAAATGVTWQDAHEACTAAGKRLCSEEEWMIACTGQPPVDRDKDGVFSDDPIVGRKYPYGAVQQPGWCASARTKDDPRPLITGNHPRCATPEGVFDLEGLTKEWIGVTPDRAAVKGPLRPKRPRSTNAAWLTVFCASSPDTPSTI